MVPHAPLLLDGVAGKGAASTVAPVVAAIRSIDLGSPDVIVVASPHGSATGVYARTFGDLDAFGPRGISVSATADEELASALAREWGRPLLGGGVDHGVVVPLQLLETSGTGVVAACFAEGLDVPTATAEAAAFCSALDAVAGSRDVAFVASANTSAGLDDRAPLTALAGAKEADAALLAALRDGPRRILGLLEDLERAGSCAAAPLAAFAGLFPATPCSVLAYEHPVGVGYPVALTR